MRFSREIKSRIFLISGMVSPIILGTIVLVVGFITPGYDQVSESVSLMGTPEQPYAWLLSSGYWTYGILMGLAAYGLNRTFFDIPQIKSLSILLGIHAIGTILLAVFPDSTISFSREMIHNAVSAIAYAPLLAMVYILRNLTSENPSFSKLRSLGLFVLIFNIPLPFLNILGPLAPISGLLQRVLCACSFTWLRLAFFALYKRQFLFVGNTAERSQLFPVQADTHVSTGLSGIEVGNILQENRRF